MPKFDFFCKSCGLLFERTVQDKSVAEVPCKSCGTSSSKYFKPHSIGVTYKGGLPPTASIDQIVGSDAEKRWNTVNNLHSEADKIRKDSKIPVVEVSSSGALQTPSKETLSSRKQVADIVVNPQSSTNK